MARPLRIDDPADQDVAFRADMERRFGSDGAIGVYFVLDETGERLSAREVDELGRKLGGWKNMPGMQSFLPDGGSGTCCTDYALHIARRMPGRVEVYGFANEENPLSRVAREEIHPGGHDFAVVDGRYIVDPWIRLVASEEDAVDEGLLVGVAPEMAKLLPQRGAVLVRLDIDACEGFDFADARQRATGGARQLL